MARGQFRVDQPPMPALSMMASSLGYSSFRRRERARTETRLFRSTLSGTKVTRLVGECVAEVLRRWSWRRWRVSFPFLGLRVVKMTVKDWFVR